MGWACSRNEEIICAYRVLVLISKGKRPVGRNRLRWEDNFKMDLQEVGCGDMDWIERA
jgi:hypothetical protein